LNFLRGRYAGELPVQGGLPMAEVHVDSLLKHFESLPDPRSERNRQHLLMDVIAIAVCGVLVGCEGPTAIRLWSQEKEDWLSRFL
jgi:hypothetical protein